MIALPPPYADIHAIVSILCILPTFCLYGAIMRLVFWHTQQDYHTPFYKLFVVGTCIAAIITTSTYFTGHILGAPMFLPLVEVLPHSGPFPTFFLCLLYYGIYAGELINCALAFNRFSIVILKHNYRDWWNRHLKQFVAVVLIFPFVFLWIFLISTNRIYIFDDNNPSMGYHLSNFDYPIWASKQKSMIAVYAFTGISSIIMNTTTLTFLIKKQKTSKRISYANDDASPKNVRFFLYIMLTFVAECMTASIQVQHKEVEHNRNSFCH
uniref:Serpentine receptor class gamma n=1 Tax=Panagrellus redivivus TaxID=6233 RepID=A0A7E4VQU8_PANRE